jgi:predicted CoA-binding protein
MNGAQAMAAAQTVAILGASADTGRYAFKAQRLLKEKGHRVVPVNPRGGNIDGETALESLEAIEGAVDTLTVYLRPTESAKYADQILALRPGRVIFNPGTENTALVAQLEAAGIPCEEACTLVLLRTGQF